MSPPDNEQTDNKARDTENEKTVILMRCPQHGLAYMANESCPECDREKGASAGDGA